MSEPNPAIESQLGDDLLAELADEFLRRCQAGENPSVDEYADKHPELAERIRDLFPAVMVMEQQDAAATFDFASATERVGAIIGRYKLLERIGEGGFGVVYMAEQQQPVRRKVALKLVKPGMDSRQVLARFDAERQALAIMDHPNIAKVFDAGATDSGRPYFVMELVRGEPITEFCDRNQFSPRERLELFGQVCHAVQHAHQKGIIHRDIKPTNVLVAMHDTTPVVKVIDFGVAKALGQELTDKTLFTGFAQFLGTPLYMSPEQAGQSALDIDTRSDIYSLGVLLYELLTGTTPFDKERFRQAAHDEICRIIREEEPPRPSTRLSESKDALPSISAQRHTEPAKLTKLVRGELDWIVMKALEKERTRRYETAIGMARDIERYLRDEPVEACPPSTIYRMKKFVRRNKGPVAAGAAVVLALAFGLALATFGFIQAKHQRAIAQENAARADREAESANKERSIALDQAARADREAENARTEAEKQAAVTKFITDMFSQVVPENVRQVLRPNDITVMQVVDAATKQLDAGSLRDSPEVELAVRKVLTQLYTKIGQLSGAERHALVSLDLAKQLYGEAHEYVGVTLNDLADVLRDQGKNDEAEELLRPFVAIQRKMGADSEGLAITIPRLANVLVSAGNLTEAEALYREALAIRRKVYGEAHEYVGDTLNDLADVLRALGKNDEAEELLRPFVAIQRKMGADSEGLAITIPRLASVLASAGNLTEAEALFREALAIRRKVYGEVHENVGDTLNDLANLLVSAGNLTEAETLHREALAIRRKVFGEESGKVGLSLQLLDSVLRAQEKTAEFEALWRERLEYWQKELAAADKPQRRAEIHLRMFRSLMNTGQVEQAKATCRKALELNPSYAGAEVALSSHAGELATSADPAHRDPALAVELAEKAVELSPQDAFGWQVLGWAYYRTGNWQASIEALDKSCNLQGFGDSFQWFFLAMAHWQLGNQEKARKWYADAADWMDKTSSNNEVLIRFRAEAAELLGLNAKKESKPSSTSTQ